MEKMYKSQPKPGDPVFSVQGNPKAPLDEVPGKQNEDGGRR